MTRIISAIILIPLALAGVIYANPACYFLAIGLIGAVCLFEYFKLTRAMGIHVQPWFGCIAFWILLAVFRQNWFPAPILLALVLMASMLSAMWRHRLPMRERVFGLMAELLGSFYFALFLYPAIALRFDFGDRTGFQWTIILLIVIWAGDSGALAIGKTLGRTSFASVLSPKKTNEGAIGGLLSGLAAAAIWQHFIFPDLPLRHVLISSILVGAFGQLGDLAESMFKRAADVKDSSQLIPGHGGMLDRMDSLLFAFPVLYFYLLLIYKQGL